MYYSCSTFDFTVVFTIMRAIILYNLTFIGKFVRMTVFCIDIILVLCILRVDDCVVRRESGRWPSHVALLASEPSLPPV